jgi:hypothetical protein
MTRRSCCGRVAETTKGLAEEPLTPASPQWLRGLTARSTLNQHRVLALAPVVPESPAARCRRKM